MAIVKNEIDKILQAATTRMSNDPGAAVRLNSSATIFKITDAISDPASITFTAVLAALEGSIAFSITGGTLTSITATGATLTYANMTADSATVTATVTSNGQTYSDSVVVAKVRDGVAGTNSATVRIYQRTASATAPALPTLAATYTFATGAITGLNNGWLAAVPTTGGAYLHTSNATASATTATDSIAATEWAAVSLMAQDGAIGADGLNTATVYAYQRATTAPTLKPGAVTWDFASASITSPATLLNGWQKTLPAGTDPLYVVSATARASTATDTIADTEWSGVVLLAASGAAGNAGAAGLNSATVSIYQRSASSTAPALPSLTTTYTFSSGGLTNLNNGWTRTIPTTGGQYLHTTQATAAATTATDDIPATEWAAVQLMHDATEQIAAKAAADAANLRLANMAADGKLTKEEKAQVILDFKYAGVGFDDLVAKADAVGVSRVAYGDAKVALNQYLEPLIGPLYNDASFDSDIVRQTFIDKFAAVFSEKDLLTNAIAAKAATTANVNSIAGMNHFRVITFGASSTTQPAGAPGLHKNGASIYGAGRSYSLAVIRRSDAVVTSFAIYDVYLSATAAGNLATALNAVGSDSIVVVWSYDEPQLNRLASGLDTAMYRCGASRAVFGSTDFKNRAAYCLVGIPGCGEGNGAEFYQGTVDNDTSAWIDVAFTVANGNYNASGSYTPRSLKDYGYVGALDATKGATWATDVIGKPADSIIYNDRLALQGDGRLLNGTTLQGQVTSIPTVDLGTGTTVFGQRQRNDAPSEYPVGTTRQFKDAQAVGVPGAVANDWCTLETIKQYPDASGGGVYQYVLIGLKTWRRWAASAQGAASTWGTWVQDLDRNAYTGDLGATNDLTLSQFGVTINGNTLTKTGGTANLWDAAANGSGTGSPAAFVSMVPANLAYMAVGLSTAPGTSNSWEQLNYALEFLPDGNVTYMESGAVGGVLTTYTPNADTFTVEHDGRNAVYRKNGVVIRSTPSVTTAPLFFDSSFYTSGASVKNVRFVPLSSVSLPSFSASGSNTLAASKPNSAVEVAIGTATLTPSGGKAPYTYQWSVTGINFDPDGRTGTISLGNSTSAQVNVSAHAANDTRIMGYLIGVVTDAENRSATVQFPISCQFGTPT